VRQIRELSTQLILPCGMQEGQVNSTTSMVHDTGGCHGWSMLGGFSSSVIRGCDIV
jgi:hypothetical protein